MRDEPKREDSGTILTDNQVMYSSAETIRPLRQKEVIEAWKVFVEKIGAPQLKSALGSREPYLVNESQIEYELDSELQLNRLTDEIKPKLLGYLRQQFQNEAIEIQFRISAHLNSQPNIPYTEAERWASLVEKYPALATLKSKFGLDFEHF